MEVEWLSVFGAMQMAQWLGLGLGLGIGLGSGFDYFRQSEPRTLVHGESSVRHLHCAEYRKPSVADRLTDDCESSTADEWRITCSRRHLALKLGVIRQLCRTDDKMMLAETDAAVYAVRGKPWNLTIESCRHQQATANKKAVLSQR